MKLELKRIFKGKEYSIGKLYIDGVYFCDTMEDPVRVLKDLNGDGDFDDLGEGKIKGNTAIPAGTYRITLDVASAKYGNIEPYKSICNGRVPRLLDVPGYMGILIHIGNTPADTEGCILLGFNKVKGQVVDSRVTWIKFYEKIKGQKDLTITII